MIQTGRPSPTIGRSDSDTQPPPGVSETVDSDAIGVDVAPGRMGENDSSTEGGPSDQGAASVGGGIEESLATAEDRSSDDAIEQLSRENIASTDSASPPLSNNTSAPTANIGQVDETAAVKNSSTHADAAVIEPADPALKFAAPRRDSTPTTSSSTTGWAKASQDDAITSRLHAASSISLASSFRDPAHMARLLMNGRIVQFGSHEEKAAVEEEAKKIADRRAQDPNRQRSGQTKSPTHRFASLSAKTQRSLADKLVAGKHPGLEYLHDASKQQQWQYNIMKMGFMNDTYLRKDRLKFVNKVRSLLPASYVSMDQKRGKDRESAIKAKA